MIAVRGVCVLGLGLIGGSVLRAVTAAGRPVWGATTSTVDASEAVAAGYPVEQTVAGALRRAVDTDALVVLAAPLDAVGGLLATITELAPQCRLTDVVSVKAPVADMVRRHTPLVRYVGGHPMAGTAESGWAAGSADLFRDAAWVVNTEDDGDAAVWRDVVRLALDCGAHVVPAGIEEHDAAVARVSHLPHVLAAVLAAVGADGGPLAMALAAGSFADGTRVAGTRPELVAAMCEGNRDALLPAVDEALGRLGAARGSLASTGALTATVRAGHTGRQALDASRAIELVEERVELTGATVPERLRELGRRGGRVIGLAEHAVVVRTPRDED
jgi:prephenate dehydrogenase